MVKVQRVDLALALNFLVKVVATLKNALMILPAIERLSKSEVVVIFSYDTHGESLYISPADMSAVNARILREKENKMRSFTSLLGRSC